MISVIMDGDLSLSIRLHRSLRDFTPAEWDACAGDDNPFVSHAFLSALEESHSAVAAAGWQPAPLALRDETGRLHACVPAYLKSHSYGEYVFDHAWANAWTRAGQAYYPKLQICVPFTPAPGPRLLIHPEAPPGVLGLLATAIARLTGEMDLSSAHITFVDPGQAAALDAVGWMLRQGFQFHWENPGYADFDQFLATLSARKRKQIRRERRDANAAGLTIRALTGDEITPAHWDAFFRFYRLTSDRKWGHPYLSRRFFTLLGERMADKVLLVMAFDGDTPVAGALNLIGRDCLFGRNWGAVVEVPFLHFELCYYRAIDFAIARGLKRVEAGAQGAHKLSRGYLPTPTWSAHHIPDPGFRQAIAGWLVQERAAVAAQMTELADESPFKCDGQG